LTWARPTCASTRSPTCRWRSCWSDLREGARVKALVLGGPGFIGVATCKELMRRGVETIAASRTPRPYGTFTSHVAFDRTD